MNKDSFIYVVIFTFLAAFVFVFVISAADNATAARVARNQEAVKARAFLNAAGLDPQDIKLFERIFGNVQDESVIRARIGVSNVLVKQFSGSGLWGTVTGVLAVSSDVTRIVGLDIISHSETPGLGGRIEEDWFKNQFRGERIPSGGIRIRKGEGGADSDSENGAVDGVTGASLTSAAMESIINTEIEQFRTEAGQ